MGPVCRNRSLIFLKNQSVCLTPSMGESDSTHFKVIFTRFSNTKMLANVVFLNNWVLIAVHYFQQASAKYNKHKYPRVCVCVCPTCDAVWDVDRAWAGDAGLVGQGGQGGGAGLAGLLTPLRLGAAVPAARLGVTGRQHGHKFKQTYTHTHSNL